LPNVERKQGYGARIQEARTAAGFSQKRLMEALGWPNDSNSRLSGYENEQRQPTLEDFERIAKKCNVDPAWLAFGEYRLDGELPQLVQGFKNASEEIKNVVRAALRITSRNNKKQAGQ
jgi:transcriptional regulator with XRE-family HTH domain